MRTGEFWEEGRSLCSPAQTQEKEDVTYPTEKGMEPCG